MNLLVLGANGYTGMQVVRALLAGGHTVRGLARDEGRAAPLEAAGMELRLGDLTDREAVKNLAQGMEAIINLVGYCRLETPGMRAALVEGTRILQEVTDPREIKKYIMLSTVAVYGHPAPEARLDESTPFQPDYPLGAAGVQAETIARGAFPAVILRVHQIYGAGRDSLDAVKEGRIRVLNRGDNYTSRIHVNDLVTAILAALERAEPGSDYLVADDQPVKAKEFFDELAQVMDAPPPALLEANAAKAWGVAQKAMGWMSGKNPATLNENVVGLLTGSYWIQNKKAKTELGLTLQYPTYADGYEEILKVRSAAAAKTEPKEPGGPA